MSDIELSNSNDFSLGGSSIYTKDSKELYVGIDKQYLSECSSNKLMLMVYIYFGRYKSWADNILFLTINQMVTYFGYVPDNYKGKINSQFRLAIKKYADDKYIEISFPDYNRSDKKEEIKTKKKTDIDNVGANDLFSIKIINTDLFKMVVDPDNYSGSGFVQLNFHELDIIKQSEMNIPDLIICYLAIKQYISMGEAGYKVAFPMLDTICKIVGRQSKCVSSLLDELVRLNLLYEKNCGSYMRTKFGNTSHKNFPIVYAIDEKYLCQAETALQDVFNPDVMGLPFIEPPHKGKRTNSITVDGTDDKTVKDKFTIESDLVSTVPAATIEKDISINGTKDNKVNQNPFSEEYNPPDEPEDEMPFDTSGMNPVIKPCKPFGGVFEDIKKQKSISDMDDPEFFEHMGWMEDIDYEDESDNEVDIASVGTESDDLEWEDEDIDKLLFGA